MLAIRICQREAIEYFKWKEGWKEGKKSEKRGEETERKRKFLTQSRKKKKSYAEVAKNYSKNIYPWNCEEGKRNSYYFAIIPQTVKVMAQCMINV